MSEWKKVRIRDISSVLGDGIHGTPQYDDSGDYFFINGNNLLDGKIIIKPETNRVSYDEHLKHRKPLTNRTVLVSINGTLGNIALYNGEKCILGKSTCYFNVNEDVEKLFIKYILTGMDFQSYIFRFAHGTTIKNVSLEAMRNYSFRLPPLPTQTRIAEILSAYDDAIENNNRRIALLEKAATELYREWFVRMRFPGYQTTKFVNGLPEGWEVGRVGSVVKLSRGHDLPLTSVIDGCIPVVGSSGIIAFHNKSTTDKPAIVLGRSGSTGTPRFYDCKCWVHNTAIYAKEIRENPLWVYYMLCQIDYSNLTGGSAVPTLNKNHVEAHKIVIPAGKIQDLFDSYIKTMIAEKTNLQSQSQNLARQRDLLLPRLMSGKLKV